VIERRPLGQTGFEVSVLGLGGAELGYDAVEPAEVDRMLGVAREVGVNVIDTAAAYRDSEEKIGAALEAHRSDLHLFTKCGPNWSPAALRRDIENSLARLRTDRLELVQLWAAPLDVLRQGEAIEVLERARIEGLACAIGYSGDGEAARFAVESGRFDAVQMSVNIADQEALAGAVPAALARGMGVVAKRALANVAWRIGQGPDNDHGDAYWDKLGYASEYQRRLAILDYPFLRRPLAEAAAMALRFVTALPEIATALVGTTRPERLRENATAVGGMLGPDLVDGIRERWRERALPNWTGCE